MNCQKCGKPQFLVPPKDKMPNIPPRMFKCQCDEKAKLETFGWKFEVYQANSKNR